jgi:hypothetical protein
VETKLGFDRQDVYVDDLATASKSKTATAFKTNAVFRFYPLSWLAIPLRVGLDYENKFKTNSVKRCLTIPSSDPGVTGQSCEDKLFLKNDPGGRTTGTLEAALVGVVPGVTTPLAVGAEVRDHLDVVGSVRQNSLSVSVFATPTSKAVLTRFGLGLGWTHALDDDKDAEIQKGDNWLTPFLLVGGSL